MKNRRGVHCYLKNTLQNLVVTVTPISNKNRIRNVLKLLISFPKQIPLLESKARFTYHQQTMKNPQQPAHLPSSPQQLIFHTKQQPLSHIRRHSLFPASLVSCTQRGGQSNDEKAAAVPAKKKKSQQRRRGRVRSSKLIGRRRRRSISGGDVALIPLRES